MELLRFYAERYLILVGHLKDLYMELSFVEAEERHGQPDKPNQMALSAREVTNAQGLFRLIQQRCGELGLAVSERHAMELAEQDEWEASDPAGLGRNIERELALRFFVSIDSSRITQFTKPREGWEDIAEKFPDAVEDIEEMNRCFALCRYPAAVFHSLLVVEHGLVALGMKIGAMDPKQGWDASCKKLAQIVNDGRAKNTTGLSFAFLEQLNATAQAMKHAWRNKVNHATGKPQVMIAGVAPSVAEEIMTATRGFMRTLSQIL